MRAAERGKRLIALFLFGLATFNFPLLAVPDAGVTLFGLPPLFAYLFGVWTGLILLLAVIAERRA
jgi:hypothetical protein